MLTAQEKPRISGRLYNCALNCSLPTILDRIKTIAEQRPDEDPHIDSYRQLKEMFEQWYGLDSMTWAQFDKFLSNSGFTFNDKELIFAPVLRLFLAKKAQESDCENTENLRDIIEHKTQGVPQDVLVACGEEDIPFNDPGRYMPLNAHDSNEYFYKYFGLFMCVHEFRGSTYEQVNGQAPDGLQSISTYLKDGHYELQEDQNTTDLQYKRLQEIRDIMEGDPLDSTPAAQRTNQALGAMRNFVEKEIKAQSEDSSKSFLTTPQEYCANVERFNLHENNIPGKLTYILVLLTLMKNFEETQAYAKDALSKKYILEQRHEIEDLYKELMTYVQTTNVEPKSYNSSNDTSVQDNFNQTLKKKSIDDGAPIDPSSELKLKQDTSSNSPKIDSDKQVEKSISKQAFQDILNEYRTSYWLLNCIIHVFSFGYYHHKSNTMRALEAIADHEQITSDMVQNALQQEKPDSQHQHRLSFWETANLELGKSGTDLVLKELKKALAPKLV